MVGKGDHSHALATMLERLRLEYLTDTGSKSRIDTESEFDSMIILDRNVDLITPLKSQMTYEGLVDELFSVKSSIFSILLITSIFGT